MAGLEIKGNKLQEFISDDDEIYGMLELIDKIGISIKYHPQKRNKLVSSFDKSLMPFLEEDQPKIKRPEFDEKMNYHKEFWRVFLTNEILIESLKEISMDKVIIEQKLVEYEKIYKEFEIEVKPKLRRRRSATEIIKTFLVKSI